MRSKQVQWKCVKKLRRLTDGLDKRYLNKYWHVCVFNGWRKWEQLDKITVRQVELTTVNAQINSSTAAINPYRSAIHLSRDNCWGDLRTFEYPALCMFVLNDIYYICICEMPLPLYLKNQQSDNWDKHHKFPIHEYVII